MIFGDLQWAEMHQCDIVRNNGLAVTGASFFAATENTVTLVGLPLYILFKY
jgi:hypothetical protein